MPPEARRAQLVQLGVELLVSEPLDNLTVPTIAKRAGVSRALVFHYFPSVRDLHLACLGAAAEELVETIVEAVGDGNEIDQIRRGLEVFVDYLSQQPTTFLAMAGYATTDAEFGGVFETVRRRLIDLMIEMGKLDADPLCRLMLRGWVAFVEASIVEWMAQPSVDRDQLIDLLVSINGDVIARWSTLKQQT
jgi:AcrR family transcriptional regulator